MRRLALTALTVISLDLLVTAVVAGLVIEALPFLGVLVWGTVQLIRHHGVR